MNVNPAANSDLRGVITSSLSQPRPGKKWRVRFSATDWFADAEQMFNFEPGDIVRVIGQKTATTLLVEPI